MQVRGVLLHAMSGAELSRVRTEFRLRLPEPINKSPLASSGADIVTQSRDPRASRARLDPNFVVYSLSESLFATSVLFRGLHRDMPY
jgi:hypothetical protein